ncbi:MAG: hypothetical protein LKJ76_08650 [Lachnospiraceae bacterium]|jgi:ABC-2 type transport system permease protein|nr:hypothetical protein [Lachnospiraceae bacterium]
MRNYISADLKRICRRIPRAIVLASVYVILILIVVLSAGQNTWNSVTFTLIVEQYIAALTVIFGIIELISVYSDDFKAKTMQVAIGTGLQRDRVVFSKYTELLVLTFADLVLFAAAALISAAVVKTGYSADQAMEISVLCFKVWLSIAGYSSLSMILIFFTQATGLATLLYLGLAAKIVSALLSLLTDLDAIQFLHLNRLLLSTMLDTFGSRLVLNNFNVPSFIGILVYIGIGYAATVFLFRKRELEF